MSMSTTQLAERYGCVSMTLEMPFKDNFNLPDEVYGWAPQGSKYLAYACLDGRHAILPGLKAAKSTAASAAKVPAGGRSCGACGTGSARGTSCCVSAAG